MIEFQVITNRRLGVMAEVVQTMLNDGWKATGPMFVLPSGLVAQPMQKETVAKKKRASPKAVPKEEKVEGPNGLGIESVK